MTNHDLSYEEFVRAYDECEAEGQKNISGDMTRKKTKKGSKSTHLKFRDRLLNERRFGFKQGVKPSDDYLNKHQNDFQTELAKQINNYDAHCRENDAQKLNTLNDAIQTVAELEQEVETSHAAYREKCEMLALKEAQLSEVSTISKERIAAAEKRAEDAIVEKTEAEQRRDEAVREADRFNLLLEKTLEDKVSGQKELLAKSAECSQLRQKAEEYRNTATAAATEVIGKDQQIEDLRAREKDALSKLHAANEEISKEREKTMQLSVELAMTKDRLAANLEKVQKKPSKRMTNELAEKVVPSKTTSDI